MARLIALPAFGDALPAQIGAIHLAALAYDPLWRITPFAGKAEALGAMLQQACALGLPAAGQRRSAGAQFVQWDGHDGWLVSADLPAGACAGIAGLVDYADALASVQISGAGVRDVLARLVPLDLRAGQFGVGAVALSVAGQHPVRIVHLEGDSFVLMVGRSMAASLLAELCRACDLLAAHSVAP